MLKRNLSQRKNAEKKFGIKAPRLWHAFTSLNDYQLVKYVCMLLQEKLKFSFPAAIDLHILKCLSPGYRALSRLLSFLVRISHRERAPCREAGHTRFKASNVNKIKEFARNVRCTWEVKPLR